jgi:putative serine/threonine protein kinase
LSQTPLERIPVSEFDRIPYLQVLTYPKPNLTIARARVRQLQKLGVTEIIFAGDTKIGRLGILGLGTVSIVVRASVHGNEHALKIRRCDANRKDMFDEFRLTQLANRVGVGAQAQLVTKDFIVMQLILGEQIDDHLRTVKGKGTRLRVRNILHALFNQCRKLDLVNLDHGQLSDLRKHVIVVGDNPYIIDFESSSTGRTTKNVTTAAQSMLIGGRSSPLVRRILGLKSSDDALNALREYKKDMSDDNYAALLNVIGIRS